MKVLHAFIATLFFLSFSLSCTAQETADPPTNYSDCAAILFAGEMLVDDYSLRGTCKIDQALKGTLSVATVSLSEDGGTPVKNIGFTVAIKNDRTQTIWMYSTETLQEVQLQDILKKCEKGDRILIMTVDQQFALPHPEIELI